ncbi:MAG: tyrosine--tRNA ligase, partial [Parcubacteria group bacterium]
MDKIKQLLERGVEEVIKKEHLEKALKAKKKLRVKFGIDPTAKDLHLGHTVPLR